MAQVYHSAAKALMAASRTALGCTTRGHGTDDSISAVSAAEPDDPDYGCITIAWNCA
jgi:hypothetical protein